MSTPTGPNPPVNGNQVWYIWKTLKVVPERFMEGEAPFELGPGSSLITMGLLKRDHGIVSCHTLGKFILVSVTELMDCGHYDHDWL